VNMSSLVFFKYIPKGSGDGVSYNTETVTEMLRSLVFRIPDDGQSPKTQQF
jgi:hypothetical protein